MSEKDLESFSFNKIDKIKEFIQSNWRNKEGRFNGNLFYEPFKYLIDNAFDDLRKDFLTGVTYYTNDYGKQVPIENDLHLLKSYAMSCGLSPSKVESHLCRRMNLLKPQWLINIPNWDQVDRLKTLCLSTKIENLSSECFYQHIVSWGAGIFARANDPYYQNKVMILRGNQGIGKDFFVKILLKALGPYFGTWTNNSQEKEIVLLMERSLVLNIPEFDNTHKNEIAMLKALITKYQATFRTPYARKAQSIELRTSFMSSANVEYLLRDGTGNRRYLIFVILNFGLIDKFDQFDSMQILAQFKWAFENKFVIDTVHTNAMDAYIESQTPQPIEEQVFEFWNAEFRDLIKLSKYRDVVLGDWLSAHELGGIFSKIKKEFGFGRNHVSIILHNRGCRERRKTGTFYRGDVGLQLVADFKK